MNLVVTRSPIRLLAYAVLAVPAILLAVDMTVSYKLYPEPATSTQVVGTTIDENGETVDIVQEYLTVDGQAQRRRDLAFSAVLFVGGVAAMAWAVTNLMSPQQLLRAGDDGLSIRVDGARRPARLFPWDSIAEVRSGMLDDEGADVPVLSIRLDDPSMVPTDPAGGVADPPWLHLWSDEWDTPAHQLAPLLDPLARRSPRRTP